MNPGIEKELKEKFYYEDGEIKRRFARGSALAGASIGSKNPNGYYYISTSFNGKSLQIKRGYVVWFLVHGTWPVNTLEHADRDRANDRIENLLDLVQADNAQNKGLYKTNTTGMVGVSFDKEKQKWRVRAKNSRRHIGYFSTFEDATAAWRQYEA